MTKPEYAHVIHLTARGFKSEGEAKDYATKLVRAFFAMPETEPYHSFCVMGSDSKVNKELMRLRERLDRIKKLSAGDW